MAELDVADLPGWTATVGDPWMVRAPGRCVTPLVPGVRVERTRDAVLFQRTAFLAAGGQPPEHAGELHPAGSAAVDQLRLFLALRDHAAVGTALAVQHPEGLVISGERARGGTRA